MSVNLFVDMALEYEYLYYFSLPSSNMTFSNSYRIIFYAIDIIPNANISIVKIISLIFIFLYLFFLIYLNESHFLA